MAIHKGRGIAAIEYPTGMNQNGDPSQAWIKVKPDGRVDVFAGTSDIGNGSKTIQSQIVAETIGVPYEWITYDNSNTDSSPVCTGTFASRATFVAGMAVKKAAERVRERILDIAGKELEINPADLDIIDGEVVAKGSPQTKISVPDVAAAATWGHGELITGTGAQLKPYAAIVEPETGKVDLPPHSAISYAACAAEVEVDDETGQVRVTRLVQCFDVGRAINPTLVEGQIEGGAIQGLGLGVLETSYPYYPSVEHRGDAVRLVPRALHGRHARPGHGADREPLGGRAVRRQGHRRDGEQPAAAGDRDGRARRGGRLDHGIADHARAGIAGPGRKEGRRGRSDAEGQGRRLRRRRVSRGRGARGRPGAARRRRVVADSPFGTWNGVPLHEFVPGVNIHAVGGEQVLVCRVNYDAGFGVPPHVHEHTEQVMIVTDGELELTVAGQGTRTLGVGDWAVINRGVEHSVRTENGARFVEALAPVPLDHVPDRGRDLVLGPDGGAGHVER